MLRRRFSQDSTWLAPVSSACNGATRPRARSSICSTDEHDFVVRYNGGANAGHTVVSGGQTFKLSLLPTGVLRPHVTRRHRQRRRRLPAAVPRRSRATRARPASPSATTSSSATTPTSSSRTTWRKSGSTSRTQTAKRIGTTGRGIGPCYQDKVGRSLRRPRRRAAPSRHLRERLDGIVPRKNRLLTALLPTARRRSDRSTRRIC